MDIPNFLFRLLFVRSCECCGIAVSELSVLSKNRVRMCVGFDCERRHWRSFPHEAVLFVTSFVIFFRFVVFCHVVFVTVYVVVVVLVP